MSEFFKNKQKFALALCAVFIAITVAVGSFALLNRDPDAKPAVTDPEPEVVDEVPEEPEPEPEPVQFNIPPEMRGTFLVPGVDFLVGEDRSEAAVRAEVDAAFESAEKLAVNAIIVDTTFGDEVIYNTQDSPSAVEDFDILSYILSRAADDELYTYAIFDASFYESRSALSTALAVGGGSADKLASNLSEFAAAYAPDGILIDGYTRERADLSYADYVNSGGGIGFDNFLRQTPASIVKTASKAVRSGSPSTQVGLLADAVWENAEANPEGSATKATYTALSGGNADTKGFIERGYVDFVAVKAYTTTDSQTEPFGEVVSWWAGVAQQNDIPMYVVHASGKLGSGEAGWGSSDQLIRQLSEVEETSGVRGSIFNNLQKLAADGGKVAEDIKQVLEGTVEPEQVLTQLEMTRPAQATYTTSDPQATFTGASDPGEDVTLNGEKIPTDASGYFTVQKELKVGENTFTVVHKDKTLTYTITRKVEVLREAGPMDNITTEGGMSITITAVAYQDASVYAVVNGTTVPLEIDENESEQDRDGFFRNFVGEYTAPAATGEEQNLGRIVVHAEYEGQTASIDAASVKVNKKAKLEDGVAVRVVTDQAMTYPPDTLSNIPDAAYFPLPAGAMDYAVGEELVYKSGSKEYTYFLLASGLRVEKKDIAAISDDYAGDNAITGITVTSEDGFTYVTLKSAQKVTYSPTVTTTNVAFAFHNTAKVPESLKLSKNPLFTAANWDGTTLNLPLAQASSFWGYKGYYDTNGNLVLRFNNPPGSISGARIVVDSGHGGSDIGASGFLADFPESVINRKIADELVAELESRGAAVKLITSGSLEERRAAAESWNADLFVSVHNNSAPNIKAVGTEVYYFQGFAKMLASNASASVSGALKTTNRGAKPSYYTVTLSSQMPSVLVECGFVTNKDEYEKLIKSKYHKRIATAIADSLSSTIKSKSTGISASGSESAGSSVDAGDPDTSPADESSQTDNANTSTKTVEGVYVKATASVGEGKNTTLQATFQPAGATADVTWKSSNTRVATVSDSGRVTGVKAGTANITVTTKDGKHSAVCEVTVKASGSKEVKVTGIDLSESEIYLEEGEAQVIEALVDPEDADNTTVRWRSDKSTVASVDSSGKVTAKGEGECTITATTEDGAYKATCTVTVTAGSESSSSSSSGESDSGTRLKGASYVQWDDDYYEMNPRNVMRLKLYNEYWELIRGADFKWESEDRTIATVDSIGNVTAKKEGETYIYASATGYETQEWYIRVTKDKIELKSLSFDEKEVELEKGKSVTLDVSRSPSSATAASLRWTSGNDRIATVDRYGKVTAVSPGKTTITVRSYSNSRVSATCEVEVLSSSGAAGRDRDDVIEGFYVYYDGMDVEGEINMYVGDEDQFEYEFYPSSASNTRVTWESKNPKVLKIDSSGNFEALKEGTATVVITPTANPSARVTFRVKVQP